MHDTVRTPVYIVIISLVISLITGLVGGFGLGYGIASREANVTSAQLVARVLEQQQTNQPAIDNGPEILENVSPTAALEDAADYARRGPEAAKIKLAIFSDPLCPYCRRLALEIEPKLIEKYGDQIAITYRHFAILGEESRRTAVALDCAGQAGKFWDYHALIYADESSFDASRANLIALAKQIGLDEARFSACLDKPNRQVDTDLEVGKQIKVNGTPTTFINGVRLAGALPLDFFTAAIDEQLRLSNLASQPSEGQDEKQETEPQTGQ
jgi:protein-disulfide isomerase